MNEKDYYAILGVDEDASADEIRRTFQKKARTLHPDVNKEPGAEEKFKEISEAYAVLSDPDKRKRYDSMRKNPFAGGWGSASGYGGSAGSGSASSGSGQGYGGYGSYGDDPFAGWGGFPFGGFGGFGSYTGQSSSQRTTSHAYNPRPGADIAYEISLGDTDAREGCKRGVTYQHYTTCTACKGKGSTQAEHTSTCPTCGGTGHMTLDFGEMFGMMGFGAMRITCPECEGSGHVVANPCSVCGGSGRILSADELMVEVPARSHDGDVVRISGKGNAGTNGEEAGDFVARLTVPSERLSMQSASGFRMLGTILPLFAYLVLSGRGMLFMALFLLPGILFSGFALYQGGLSHRSTGWWRSGLRAMAQGASNSMILVLLMAFFNGCSRI